MTKTVTADAENRTPVAGAVAGVPAPRAAHPRRPLTDSELLLGSVIDSLDGRMCILGQDGQIIGTNRLWDDFTDEMRWSPDDSRVGADFYALLGRLRGDLGKELAPAVRAIMEGARGQSTLRGYLPLAGRGEDVVVQLHPMLDHDAGRVVVTVIDISAAVQAERELRRITAEAQLLALVPQHTEHGVVIADAAGQIEWANDAFCRSSGYPLDELVGRRRRDLIGGSFTRTPAYLEFAATLSAGRSASLEFPTRTGTGGSCWVHVETQPVLEDGLPVRFISVERDITEQRAAHEIVLDNTHFLGESITDVLATLRQIAELTEAGDPTAERLRVLLHSVDLEFLSAEIPAVITQSLEGLQQVRTSDGTVSPAQEPLTADLNQAVESTVEGSRNEWLYIAEVDLDLEPDVGLVRCDEGELKQVLLNLVINAAQAISGQDGREDGYDLGHISLSTERVEGGIRITVADDGPGLEESARQKIFDPFVTSEGQNPGQGLSAAYAVIQKHGGTLSVSSTPGAGTVFTIDLPDQPLS